MNHGASALAFTLRYLTAGVAHQKHFFTDYTFALQTRAVPTKLATFNTTE